MCRNWATVSLQLPGLQQVQNEKVPALSEIVLSYCTINRETGRVKTGKWHGRCHRPTLKGTWRRLRRLGPGRAACRMLMMKGLADYSKPHSFKGQDLIRHKKPKTHNQTRGAGKTLSKII